MASSVPSSSRRLYIDRLRAFLVIFVVVMHAAVTYSGLGGWYYKEGKELQPWEFWAFAFLQSHLQAFFMGLLFFLAGSFVPQSLERKGFERFLKDRWFRLGLPSVFYVFFIHPLTVYSLYTYYEHRERPPLGSFYLDFLTSGRFLSASGPLWFAVALLIFSALYAVTRRILPRPRLPMALPGIPGHIEVVGFVLFTGLVSALVRVVQPMGTNIFNMQLCYFTQYVVMFLLGIRAQRGDWLLRLPTRFGLQWLAIASTAGSVLWFLILATIRGNTDLIKGGWIWQSFGFAWWEELFCAGASLGFLVCFREWINGPGLGWDFLCRNSFAVYVFHTPVLIAVTFLLRGLDWIPSAKFVLATILALTLVFGLSEWFFRRIPGLRQIL